MTQTQPQTLPVDAARTRTYSWRNPLEALPTLARLSGMQQMQAMLDGLAAPAPLAYTLGFDGLEVLDEGRVCVEMTAQEFHYNPIGSVHGGVLAAMLDTACGCAVHTTLALGELYTSLDLTTKFLRPATLASGVLRCEGAVLNRGRRTALAEARLTDASGRLVAHATSTCMIFRAE
jgi:uncharacterized protein (TIGR00369 family)